MPTNTSKFNLVKPLKSEKYNVDVFNGNADIIDSQIYSKTEVDTALNGKANSVHTHPISEVTNLQTALDAKVDKLMATNLIANGDFSNGTTGWTLEGLVSPTIVTNIVRDNNSLQVSVNNQTSRAFRAVSSSIGDRIYSFAQVYLESVTTLSSNIIYQITTPADAIISNVVADVSRLGQWQRLSNIATATTSTTRFSLGRTTNQTYTAYFDSVGIINLTALFGAGNEPTRLEMDKLLSVYPNSWFNGTSEIGSIGALMRASLGVQVVTPTLLNSRTGTAQYVVSSDGLVIFRGTASGGSLNTNIFVLPENIRPTETRTFPISANNAFGVITVATNGEVRQTVGALTNVFLDGIAFKVGVA